MSRYQKYYQKRKLQLTEQAIDWQMKFSNGEVLYYSDLADACEYFTYWGKRFGLLGELKENGII